MYISKFEEYLVTNRTKEDTNKFVSHILTSANMGSHISEATVDISLINTYEIYTKDPETGKGGWDIKNVRSTDELIKRYPNFDAIITKNDCSPTDGDWLCLQTANERER